MSRVAIEKGKLRIGRERLPLLSGELHFWRVRPVHWRRALEGLGEMGLPIVSTYVCWEHHELAPGHFDFTGETDASCDLVGFLRLAQSLGFVVLLRPGPYIYAEWKNLGVPDRAAKLSRTSPAFLDDAFPYLRAVVEAARPHLATNGGPIALWQADNEIDVMPWAYERELGAGNEPGAFQAWLGERYGTVAALNEAWGTAFRALDEARPIVNARMDDAAHRPRHLDWIRFRQEANTEHARWMVRTYRSLGVDVPVLLNSYPVQDSLSWRQLAESSDLFGIDPYPSDGFRADEQEHRVFVEKCLVQSTLPTTPYLAEFESGVWRGHEEYAGTPGPAHYRLSCLSALAAGVQGWNWYMTVERDNWLFSPIDNRGAKRQPLFETFRSLAAIFGEMDPPRLKRAVHTAAFHDPMHAAFRGAYADDPARKSLYEAGVPYSLWDPADERAKRAKRPLLFYSGPEWLDREGHERLLRFVEEGGRLVLPGRWPRYDERFEPHDRLGIPPPDLCFEAEHLVIPRRSGDVPIRGPVLAYGAARPPGEPLIARVGSDLQGDDLAVHRGLLRRERHCVGFAKPLGQGEILVLGFAPTPEATLWIHEKYHVPITARALTPRTQACLLETARGQAWLVVLNLADREQRARVALSERIPWEVAGTRLHGGEACLVPRGPGQELSRSIPARDGAVVVLKRGTQDSTRSSRHGGTVPS